MSFDLNATKDNNGDGMFHLPSTSLDEEGGGGGDGGKRILMAAVLVLFLTTILVFLVHIYAEWCWTRFLNHRRQLFERSQEEQLPSSSLPPRKLDSGLDKAVIESLPVFVYSNNNNRVRLGGRGVGDEEEDEALECAVCLCEFEANEKGRLLPRCKHRFHTDCIDMWFHSHSTCPLCRASISERSNLNPNLNPDANGNSNPNPNANPSGNPNADVGLETIETQEIALSLPEGGGSGNPLSRPPQQNLGVQYPTNVLFWGDHYHVSSHINSPTHPNHGQSGLNIAIDIPSNIELISRPLPSHDHSTSSRYPLMDNQTYTTSGHPAIKSLKTFKRFLSRDRRINPPSSSSSSSSSLSSSFNQDERCRESNQGIAISLNS